MSNQYDNHYVTVRIRVDDDYVNKVAIVLSINSHKMAQCVDYDPVYNNLGYFVVPEEDIVEDLGECKIDFIGPLEKLAETLYDFGDRKNPIDHDYLINLN